MKKINPEFTILDQANILTFLKNHLKNMSLGDIKSLLIHGDVLVDDKVINDFNYQLSPKEKVIVKLYKIYDKKLNIKMDILYEDNDLLVINKPEGLLTISTSKEKDKTAYHIASNYVKQKNKKNRIFIVHRLDKDTSGILLFAKNQRIKNILQDKWNDIVMLRGYVAIVEGSPKQKKGTIKSWLKETQTQLVYSSKKAHDAKEAITHYETILTNNKYSLLSIKIDTGRKNQIRVHMKDIGNSIIGDQKYGSNTNPIKRLGLHAYALTFKNPLNNEIMIFETDVPDIFLKLFNT